MIHSGRSRKYALMAGVALSLSVALTMCHPAFAGVTIPDIPNNAKAGYVQGPDGTWYPAQGDSSGNAKSTPSTQTFTKLGCGQITSLGSAVTFPSVPVGSLLVTIQVEGQSVRYRDDGTNPTASVGVLLPVAGPWPYQADLAAIKFIQTTASATINYCFYK